MSERILIVDDDPVQRRLLDNMVRKFGYEPLVAEGGDAAIATLTSADGAGIDAVVLDLVMPDLDGLGVLAKMREAGLTLPVIVQTAHGGIDNVVTAMRAGATDFVVKPVGAERLQVSLRNALAASMLEGELARIKRSRSGTLSFKDIVTRSPRMQAVLRTAEKAATSAIPVLIEGQSGVGKELIARAIHGSGERRAKPFVAVNCGAIPDNLVESLLFGHEKGAFTGATERHTGKFVEATGGTLFLDEVGELPPGRAGQAAARDPGGRGRAGRRAQAGQGRRAAHLRHQPRPDRRREGGPLPRRPVLSPARLPHRRSAACANAPKTSRSSRDISSRASRPRKASARRASAPRRWRCSRAYRWPGNVRQLENAVFRAVVLAEGDTVGLEEFPQIASQTRELRADRQRGARARDPGGGRRRKPTHGGRGRQPFAPRRPDLCVASRLRAGSGHGTPRCADAARCQRRHAPAR